MMYLVAAIIAVIVLIIVINMIISRTQLNNAKKEAKDSLSNFIEALKNGEEEKIAELKLKKNLNKEVFSKIEYEVKTSEGDLENQKVKISITNKDMETVMARFNTLKSASKGTDLQSQIKDSAIKQIIESNSTPVATNEIEVDMKKEENEWKIVNIEDEVFINALLPGIKEYLESEEDSFGGFVNNLFQEQ